MSLLQIDACLWANGLQEQRIPLGSWCGDPAHVSSLVAHTEMQIRLALLQRLYGASQARVARLARCRGLNVDVVCDLLLAGNRELAEQMRRIG